MCPLTTLDAAGIACVRDAHCAPKTNVLTSPKRLPSWRCITAVGDSVSVDKQGGLVQVPSFVMKKFIIYSNSHLHHYAPYAKLKKPWSTCFFNVNVLNIKQTFSCGDGLPPTFFSMDF
ncbi:hypothetical protein AVEN_210079-1 [Araneus ventricosus]|uniref:Uncharacterized protein n=1 Tax=Araneus ventricosus TaxID=182803 RepID=A0A4Y2VAN1_ARAVE|nr:hypothetical protein AVEN_119672-1 [Araneus ventricosus]GBO20781.1 hypothetical protein AVEN_210079-1 [Araneus ventricosus]